MSQTSRACYFTPDDVPGLGSSSVDDCALVHGRVTHHTAETVRDALAWAVSVLVRLQLSRPGPHMAQSKLETVANKFTDYAPDQCQVRPAIPDPHEISEADRIYGWLALIPQHKYVLRRIVAARAIARSDGKPMYTYRQIGAAIGCPEPQAVSRWHRDGLALIARELNRAARPSAAAPLRRAG
jgi:hypothetical protein